MKLKSIILATLAVVSCSKAAPQQQEREWGEGAFSVKVSFPDEDSTRAGIEKDGSVYHTVWSTGDVMSINGHISQALTQDKITSPRCAEFLFEGYSPAQDEILNAIFPGTSSATQFVIPSNQTYSGSSFCNSASPFWGTAVHPGNLTLNNICSVFAFNMTGTKAITRVTVQTVGGEKIAGSFSLKKDSKGKFDGRISGGDASLLDISLNYAPGTPLYIPVKAVNASKGFIVRMYDSAGKHMALSFFSSGKEMNADKVYSFPSVAFEPTSSDVTFTVEPYSDFQELEFDNRLTIGTYNILSGSNRSSAGNNTWDNAKSTTASIINGMCCDVMTLNELNANDITYLTEALPDYSWVLKKNYVTYLYYPIVNEEKYQNLPGIIYRDERLEVKSTGLFYLNDPEPVSLVTRCGKYSYDYNSTTYSAPAGLCCQYALFKDKKTDTEFWWFATHLNIRSTDKETPYYNTAASLNSVSARSLVAQVNMVLASHPAPFIVAGDMNACPTTYGYDTVLKGAWQEARDLAGLSDENSGTCPGFVPDKYSYKNTLFIDHLMCNSTMVYVQNYSKILTKYTNPIDSKEYHPSDHTPVRAQISFK